MQEGYKSAAEVPLEVVEYCYRALNTCDRISKIMDDSMASDVGSGAQMSIAGARAAAYNVKINLKTITDSEYTSKTNKKLEKLLSECERVLQTVIKRVEKKF